MFLVNAGVMNRACIPTGTGENIQVRAGGFYSQDLVSLESTERRFFSKKKTNSFLAFQVEQKKHYLYICLFN